VTLLAVVNSRLWNRQHLARDRLPALALEKARPAGESAWMIDAAWRTTSSRSNGFLRVLLRTLIIQKRLFNVDQTPLMVPITMFLGSLVGVNDSDVKPSLYVRRTSNMT
jgi:hypothetical protein